MTNPPDPDLAQPAIEQLPIPLFDGVVLAARSGNGLIHLSLRDLCQTIGLDVASQRRRIRNNDSLHLTQLRAFVDGQFRTLDFLLLDDLSLWLLGIQIGRVNPENRERIAYIKHYLEASVRDAFAQFTGLPESSHYVEDLRDLDRLDQAVRVIDELNDRQIALEASQDRARIAFRELAMMVRELRDRVQTLEQSARQRLSPAQRGAIYQLVQAWGNAVAERQSARRSGEAIRGCWRQFNARFSISTYTDLPAASYGEAIQFIKEQYRAVAGRDIDVVEQSDIGF